VTLTAGLARADDAAVHVFLVATEASGDLLGAALMGALVERLPGQVRFSGVGGDRMIAAGLETLFPINDLAIIGVSAIPRSLAKILRRIRATAAAVLAARPDVLVIIDSPDFTHRVARQVRAAAPALPIVDYVSPSVWAWRPGRARTMRRYVDHVLALLPFEPRVYSELGGPPCSYVGHPLIEEIGKLRPNAQEERRRSDHPPTLLVLPGSRKGEIDRMLSVFGATISLLRTRHGELDVVLPTLPHLRDSVAARVRDWPLRPRLVSTNSEKQAAFRTARVALAKSGTITLELALAGIPMVTAYRVSLIEELIAHLAVRVPSIILANLVIGENVIPEFLQRACRPQVLADALAPLLIDGADRQRQLAAFARLDSIMEIGKEVPSRRAANIVLGLARPSLGRHPAWPR
jgi:lipid-A-disaccharide synthase